MEILPGYKKNIIKIMTVFFCLFPWITRLKVLDYNDLESSVFGSYNGQAVDLFLYYKEIAVIVAAIFLIFWFLGEYIFVDKADINVPLIKGRNKCLFFLAGVFCFMVIISTVLSQNRKTALWGSPTEGEGVFTLIGYMVLILAFYNYFANTYSMRMIKIALYFISSLTIILSFSEFFYKPLLQTDVMQWLAGIKKYTDVMEKTGIEKLGNAVSLSFYNPSYYGGFLCILLPFMMVFCFHSAKKKEILAGGILSAGLLFCIMLSNSTTALYIAIFEIVLLILLYMLYIGKIRKKVVLFRILGCLPVFLLMAALYSFFTSGSVGGILKNDNSITGKVFQKRFVIEKIVLDGNHVLLQGEKSGLNIVYIDGQIQFMDEKGNNLQTECKKNIFAFKNSDLENVTVKLVPSDGSDSEILARILVDAGYDDTVDFYILKDGSLSGIGQNGSIIRDIGASEIPDYFKQYYGIFTGRGYAWAHSLPILKKTILKGVGPGNFAFYFKQQDYVGMLKTHGSTKYIIDKPHNAYLQYGIQVGFVGMLAFFGIFVLVIGKTMKSLKKKKEINDGYAPIQIGGITVLAGFFLYSIINDSMVTVTPVVCMIMGIMLATEYAMERKVSGEKST